MPPYPLLLEEAHQITFHQRYINSLMITDFKYLNGHSLDEYFQVRRKFVQSPQLLKTLAYLNTDSMLFRIVLANSGNKCLLISVKQLL